MSKLSQKGSPRLRFGEAGIIHLPLILIAVVGIIAFMLISSTAPFKNNLLSTLFPKQFTHAATPTDWNQVQKDPQRSGFTSESLGSSWKRVCSYPFQPERVYPQVQAIVYGGVVYIGTEMGNLYSINGTNCAKNWSFQAGGPILGSVAADNGQIYFGSMDGAVYAVDTSGTLIWKKQLSSKGFSAAPLLVNNKIMLGGRDGKFYGLDTMGNKLWEYNAGAPILMTAAASSDGTKAYFGSMDMYVHAVNIADGTRAWKTQNPLKGLAFKDYWPVVHKTQGLVIITAWGNRWTGSGGIPPGFPLKGTTASWLTTNSATVAVGNAKTIPDFMTAQDNALNSFSGTNPNNYSPTIFIFNETDGQIPFYIPHHDTQALDGGKTAPCIDRDNMLVIPAYFGPGGSPSGWGRVNLQTGRIEDILYDGKNYSGADYCPTPPPGQTSCTPNGTAAGFGNGDENLNVTCTQNMVLGIHTQEGNANYTGYFNLDTRRWTRTGTGNIKGEMSNNTQGGGGNPASVSNGRVYHIVTHELIVKSTN